MWPCVNIWPHGFGRLVNLRAPRRAYHSAADRAPRPFSAAEIKRNFHRGQNQSGNNTTIGCCIERMMPQKLIWQGILKQEIKTNFCATKSTFSCATGGESIFRRVTPPAIRAILCPANPRKCCGCSHPPRRTQYSEMQKWAGEAPRCFQWGYIYEGIAGPLEPHTRPKPSIDRQDCPIRPPLMLQGGIESPPNGGQFAPCAQPTRLHGMPQPAFSPTTTREERHGTDIIHINFASLAENHGKAHFGPYISSTEGTRRNVRR